MFLNSVFVKSVSKIGFAVIKKIEEKIEEKINALPFLKVKRLIKNLTPIEKKFSHIIYFFSKLMKK